MLKRLELNGFKSFAERTVFEFPPGITAIVGPNGSGKSNVVDAVRWILGEQSAKSLRGEGMADVIFNGSTTRKSFGSAEVVMTFDNSRGTLATEAGEVEIGRRVKRDGTGEYRIGPHACRLKDVKELFLGSGAGTTAYCIIEQGRVDALLQASADARREILEEAAGISRFKAKKLETLRKLDNVHADLTRLRDIRAEAEVHLKKLRTEATKAEKHRELTDRLRELRIAHGHAEYATELAASEVEEGERLTLAEALEDAKGKLDRATIELRTLDTQLAELEAERITWASQQADAGQAYVRAVEASRQDAVRLEETTQELLRTSAQRRKTVLLTAESERICEQASVDVTTAQESTDGLLRDSLRRERECTRIEERIAVALADVNRLRQEWMEEERTTSIWRTRVAESVKRLDRFRADSEIRRRRGDRLKAEQASVARLLDDLGRTDADVRERLSIVQAERQRHRAERDQLRATITQEQKILEEARLECGGWIARRDTLIEWERGGEGVGQGVREVSQLLETDPLTQEVVLGLVADLLIIPPSHAGMIDALLGDDAQKFVVRNENALEAWLSARPTMFSGRVGFLPMRKSTAPVPFAEVTVEHPEATDLPAMLFGDVRLVSDRAEARRSPRGFRYRTAAGEVFEIDGSWTVGSSEFGGGLIRRKSELRVLRKKITEAEANILAGEGRLRSAHARAEIVEDAIAAVEAEIVLLSGQVGDLSTDRSRHAEALRRLDEERESFALEEQALVEEDAIVRKDHAEAVRRAEVSEKMAADLQALIQRNEAERTRLDSELVQRQTEMMDAKLELTRAEERLTTLKADAERYRQDQMRGWEERLRIDRHEKVLSSRVIELTLATLRAAATAATAAMHKDTAEAKLRLILTERAILTTQQREQTRLADAVRAESSTRLERLHTLELSLRERTARQAGIVQRLREDFAFDLVAHHATGAAIPERSPGEEAEMDQLRERLRKLGGVRPEAIAELAESEGRWTALERQTDDLAAAEKELMEIIGKLNADSKILFQATYDTVRGHFQELFRKLFAGGRADLVLENPDAVLETGIDIIAQPPGKELRSLALMSGGEKTLTALALLLAIFRSKPSPFCLLDEVDAALDEANTRRLASVLREFLDRSQFIIITHKKRTMAIADVLYGVTMQESGVSKQVSIRFEDWPDDPEEIPIAQAA